MTDNEPKLNPIHWDTVLESEDDNCGAVIHPTLGGMFYPLMSFMQKKGFFLTFKLFYGETIEQFSS